MVKGDVYIHEKVRQLCRDINNRADDPEKLQILVIRLQDALREERHVTRPAQATARSRPDEDDPFDKIMVV